MWLAGSRANEMESISEEQYVGLSSVHAKQILIKKQTLEFIEKSRKEGRIILHVVVFFFPSW